MNPTEVDEIVEFLSLAKDNFTIYSIGKALAEVYQGAELDILLESISNYRDSYGG